MSMLYESDQCVYVIRVRSMCLCYTSQVNVSMLYESGECVYVIRVRSMCLCYTSQVNVSMLYESDQCVYVIPSIKRVHEPVIKDALKRDIRSNKKEVVIIEDGGFQSARLYGHDVNIIIPG